MLSSFKCAVIMAKINFSLKILFLIFCNEKYLRKKNVHVFLIFCCMFNLFIYLDLAISEIYNWQDIIYPLKEGNLPFF